MIEIFYRYRVHPSQVRAYEHAYGPGGPWVALFKRQDGYVRSRLFRHKSEPDVYVTVDVWESKSAWDRFRVSNSEDYARLDRELRLLYIEELFLGYYEGDEEYRAPIDSPA
jgi:heme-degrading monooxygenase HmoA